MSVILQRFCIYNLINHYIRLINSFLLDIAINWQTTLMIICQ